MKPSGPPPLPPDLSWPDPEEPTAPPAPEAPSTSPEPPTPARRLGSARSPSQPPPEGSWILEGVFPPGQVHLLGGAPGAGKTALEVWLCSHILREQEVLGHQTHRPPWWGCLIFDRSAADRLYWWSRADLAPLPYYCLTEDPALTPSSLLKLGRSGLVKLVEAALDRWQPPRGGVLTIDVANMLAADSRSTYYAGFASAWQLSRLAHDRGLTILALMHGGKQLGDKGSRYVRPTDRIIANTGFLGAVGTRAYLASAKESGDKGWQDFGWEPHHHKPEEFRLIRTGAGLFAPWQSKARALEQQQRPVVHVKVPDDVTAEDLLGYFPPDGAGFIGTGQVVELVRETYDLSARSIERMVSALAQAGLIVQHKGIRGKWHKPKGD